MKTALKKWPPTVKTKLPPGGKPKGGPAKPAPLYRKRRKPTPMRK